MATLIQMDPERQLAASIAREMLETGASVAQVQVRVNRECPTLERAAKRWTILEIERGRLSGAIHSAAETPDTPGAGEDAKQHTHV